MKFIIVVIGSQKKTMEAEEEKSSKARFNIFRNKLFQSQSLFKKVPLHFEFFHKPTLVLDHTIEQTNPGDQPQVSYCRRQRPRSSCHKIFEKRRSISSRSGLLSSIETIEKKDTICSEDRIRKGTIFQSLNHNQKSARNTLQSLLKETDSRNYKESNAQINKQHNPQKQNLEQKATNYYRQQIIYTPEQLRKLKCISRKRQSKKEQPMNPLQFYNMAKEVIQKKRARRESARDGCPLPVTPFHPKEELINKVDRESLIYRI